MPLASALLPLRRRDFALLFSAGLVSNVGTWMQTVAVGTLVVDATGKAAWAALVAAATFLPIGVLSPLGGALADRIRRKRFMVAGYLLATALSATMAVLAAAGRASPGAVVVLVFVGGSIAALVFPFHQAILPQLVPREELLAAVSLGSAGFNLGRVIGPALAGVVIAAGSYTWAFAIDAATFLFVVAALLVIRIGDPEGVPEGEGVFQSIRDGARTAWAVPGCRAAIVFISVAAVLVSPFIALVPAMADLLVEREPDDLARATGALVTAQGVGAVLGALAIAPLAQRFGRGRLQIFVLVATPLALVLYAASPTLAVAVAAILVVGACYIGILTGLSTVVQLAAPDAYRGRILSLYFVALGVVYPFGAVIQGAVADAVGLRVTTSLFALGLVAVVALVAATRPALLDALGERRAPEPAPATESVPPPAA